LNAQIGKGHTRVKVMCRLHESLGRHASDARASRTHRTVIEDPVTVSNLGNLGSGGQSRGPRADDCNLYLRD